MSDVTGSVAKALASGVHNYGVLAVTGITIFFGGWLFDHVTRQDETTPVVLTKLDVMEKKIDELSSSIYTQTDASKDQALVQEQMKGLDLRIQKLEGTGRTGR